MWFVFFSFGLWHHVLFVAKDVSEERIRVKYGSTALKTSNLVCIMTLADITVCV
jgi:hypothetical protein